MRGPGWPDPAADQGAHRFAYALLPHRGDLQSGRVVEEAEAFPEIAAAMHRLKVKPSPAMTASVMEFVLEGLHLSKRLNKAHLGSGGAVYSG